MCSFLSGNCEGAQNSPTQFCAPSCNSRELHCAMCWPQRKRFGVRFLTFASLNFFLFVARRNSATFASPCPRKSFADLRLMRGGGAKLREFRLGGRQNSSQVRRNSFLAAPYRQSMDCALSDEPILRKWPDVQNSPHLLLDIGCDLDTGEQCTCRRAAVARRSYIKLTTINWITKERSAGSAA